MLVKCPNCGFTSKDKEYIKNELLEQLEYIDVHYARPSNGEIIDMVFEKLEGKVE